MSYFGSSKMFGKTHQNRTSNEAEVFSMPLTSNFSEYRVATTEIMRSSVFFCAFELHEQELRRIVCAMYLLPIIGSLAFLSCVVEQ